MLERRKLTREAQPFYLRFCTAQSQREPARPAGFECAAVPIDQTKARDLIAPVKSHFRGGNQRPSLCTVIDNALMWKRGVAVDTNRGKKKVGRTKNRLTVVPSGPAGKERDGKSHGREVETTRLSIT